MPTSLHKTCVPCSLLMEQVQILLLYYYYFQEKDHSCNFMVYTENVRNNIILTNSFGDIVWISRKSLILRVLSLTNGSQKLCPNTILIFEFLVQYFGSIATSYVVLDEACENDNRCGIQSEKGGDGNSFADDSLLLDERT